MALAAITPIDAGWELATTAPDAAPTPADLDALDWMPATVPGTVAGALRATGAWSPGVAPPPDLDDDDHWFRVRFDAPPAAAGEEVLLRLDGIATVFTVHLNGEIVLEGESMFAEHAIDIGDRLRTDARNELAIRCRALAPLLKVRRKPRARWRTRVVDGNLRFFRTMLLGRAPGFAPGPAAVGPYRRVALERRAGVALDALAVRPRVADDGAGVLRVMAALRTLDGAPVGEATVTLSGPSGRYRATLDPAGEAELRIEDVTLWWPHTHGTPVLHDLVVETRGAELAHRRVGFRTLTAGPTAGHDVERDGLDLHVNGVGVFARGAVWTPVDFAGMAAPADAVRAAVAQARDAGMNMLRLPGLGAYETPAFHDACDELGMLVWQDFMFANLDPPLADEAFRATVEAEADQVVAALSGRPSLAVMCGNSETEQQAAMLGLDPAMARGELFGELLPHRLRAAGCDAIYVPSSPTGGTLPFRPGRGIANYFGVGGYRRGLEDVRRSEVRFAGECLAFANVPDDAALAVFGPGRGVVHHPRWKAGVPRDAGSGWDFEDVRDHYLRLLYGVDPGALRGVDHERYLELSRAVSGEVMAEVFGEWRRSASPCAGGVVLWLRDLVPGAGWGLVDSRGAAKAALGPVRRAFAPVAVWMVDEGLNGIAVHVANDGPRPLAARLRVALLRDGDHRVGHVERAIDVPAHGALDFDLEELLGRFVDASWAYRFGPPAQDAILVALESPAADGAQLISQAVRFPSGPRFEQESASRLGLEAQLRPSSDGAPSILVRSRRLACGVRIHVDGHDAADDLFCVEPGTERALALHPRPGASAPTDGSLVALNLRGRVRVTEEGR